jgi:serine/threonine-protein kinase
MMTGQTSQVWEAVEANSGRHFALKVLLPERAQDPVHRAMLFHEASVGQKMAHPNIIRIVDVNKDIKFPYFVMEFFPGGSLKQRLMRKQHDFVKDHIETIFKQAATGLAFMNAQGWVHRDVKPDNMLVNSAGELRMIDFALAQRVARQGLLSRLFKRRGKAQGTRSYMSPEQIRGLPLDGRADMYSFAVSAFELVTGRPPFRAATPTELLHKHITEPAPNPRIYNPDVTQEFADLLLHMLAKKREDRPRDFHEVLMKLRTLKVYKNVETKPAR